MGNLKCSVDKSAQIFYTETMEAWVTWAIQGVIVLVITLVGAYIRSIINGLKDKIAENKKDIYDNGECIEKNVIAISNAKTELYEHTEEKYYTKETMDAKIIALKYRRDRGGDPSATL